MRAAQKVDCGQQSISHRSLSLHLLFASFVVTKLAMGWTATAHTLPAPAGPITMAPNLLMLGDK
jgi:hypothetical protein